MSGQVLTFRFKKSICWMQPQFRFPLKAAILETTNVSGISRASILFGLDVDVDNGVYLELFRDNPSDISPYVVAEPCQIISVSMSNERTLTNASFTIYKNGVSAQTFTLTSGSSRFNQVLGTPISLVAGDYISMSGDTISGNKPKRVIFSINLKFTV
jgi:hypothetical protein